MNKVFKALDDSTRRKIVELLKQEDLTAGEISNYFDISKPSVSHHLDILKQSQLIESSRKGQFIYYSLKASVLASAAKWINSIAQQSDKDLKKKKKKKK